MGAAPSPAVWFHWNVRQLARPGVGAVDHDSPNLAVRTETQTLRWADYVVGFLPRFYTQAACQQLRFSWAALAHDGVAGVLRGRAWQAVMAVCRKQTNLT